MASLQERKHKNGKSSWILQFYLYGERKNLFLGNVYSRPRAKEVKMMIERLISCIETGDKPDKTLAAWLSGLNEDLQRRFESAGLIKTQESFSLKKIFDEFLSVSTDRKDSTIETYSSAYKRIIQFFDVETECENITVSDGQSWKAFALERWSSATVSADIGKLRTVFGWAVECEFLTKNVFKKIKRGTTMNESRKFFVPHEWYEKLLVACPDQTWKTIIALCRIGGLRCPSEVLGVKWMDVDWTNRKLLVRSPKTEHHAGRDCRIIPLWGELHEQLELQSMVSDCNENDFVVDKYHRIGDEKNMRRHFMAIVKRAGLPQWERLFHNLRASRSNELFGANPPHLASEWMGQSVKVARDHYLLATDQDFELAIKRDSGCENG